MGHGGKAHEEDEGIATVDGGATMHRALAEGAKQQKGDDS
jgi:hypothetical protein